MSAAAPPVRPEARRRIQRAFVLGWRWRAELVRATALLPRVSHRLRRYGYAATVRWLDARQGPPGRAGPIASRPDRETVALELAFIVRAAARVVPDSTCLRRALVLRDLLGRVGIPATVQLGVRPAAEDAGVAFHAWVEAEGVVVSEPPRPVADYVVLASELPPPGMAP